jgi:GMP synthase (glutamine-hydrolysing)
MSLNLLIVEGNNPKDSEVFIRAAKASCSENLKNIVLKLEPSSNITIINPVNDDETNKALENMDQYNGVIFTGGAMRLNDMSDEIKKHINFATNCFKHKNKILAICWGLQVCSTAAGGKVAPGKDGAHIGIATNVELNEDGKRNPIYKNKKLKFNTPAFNFDEVCELPKGATLLASDKVNKNMGVYFKSGNSEVWGLQYHPDYEYWQMINLSNERMGKMIAKEYFKDEKMFKKHIDFIKSEEKSLDFKNKTYEIQNWLDIIKY